MDLSKLIRKGESETLEFKEAQTALPKHIFETVCAMLNHKGGSVLLGVTDSGKIQGVSENSAESLCKDFANLSNNPQKIEPSFLIHPEIIELDGKKVIHAFIPPSSQVHRTNGKVFDRSADGDYEVKSSEQIKNIYLSKSTFYTESTIYPFLKEKHFVDGIVDKTREIIRTYSPRHPWNTLSLDQFYRVSGMYRINVATGSEGFCLAALLLFGKEEVIQDVLPHYKTNALLRRIDTERYDDRETVRYNLIDAYDALMNFVAKHLPDKFFLENSNRISLRDTIFREIIANMLIHREYTNGQAASFTIYSDRAETKNANRPHVYGELRPGSFEPFPKNPIIAKLFTQMGRAEELGTGVDKVYKYMKAYSGSTKIIFEENDLFHAVLPLKVSRVGDRVGEKVTDNQRKILMAITLDPKMTASKIADLLGISPRKTEENIRKLKDTGVLLRIGPDHGGHWEIAKKEH